MFMCNQKTFFYSNACITLKSEAFTFENGNVISGNIIFTQEFKVFCVVNYTIYTSIYGNAYI